jgi:hypothetical protein
MFLMAIRIKRKGVFMYQVKEPDGELFNTKGDTLEFEDDFMDSGFDDYIVEMLRSEGANHNYISYIRSEIEDLEAGDDFVVEYIGKELFTVTRY